VTRRSIIWLAGLTLVLASVALVGCVAATSTLPTTLPKTHPQFAAGQACDAAGCHTSYKHQQPYLGPCDKCHNLSDWTKVTYSHKDSTFDQGMHPLLGCSFCHTEGQPLPTGGCGTCHDAPHKGWTSCASCHTTIAFGLRKPAPTNHLSLLGGHANLTCLDCHNKPHEPAVPRQCVDCHPVVHTVPVRNCQACHDPSLGWAKPKKNFPHDEFFVLLGFHQTLKCAQCHKGASTGTFAGTPTVCVGCHGPHHGGLTDCAACHTTSAFIPSIFSHSSVFPLTGRHADLACTKCHPNKAFAKTISTTGGTACVGCHGVHHGGLTDCASCHTTAGFTPSTFRHSSEFVLVGAHVDLACSKCHPGGLFARNISANRERNLCKDCHGVKHGNQTDCLTCHTTSAFQLKANVDHAGQNVPLGSIHSSLPHPCWVCHIDNRFNSGETPCQNCHTNTAGITPVPHVGPSNCIDCHWPTTFAQVHDFSHPPITVTLNGVPCPHTSMDFGPYPAGCIGCHPGSGPTHPDFTQASCTCHQ
jgi:hypothetical protein